MYVYVRRRNPVFPVVKKILPYSKTTLPTKDLWTNGVARGKGLYARCRSCTRVCRLSYVVMYYACPTKYWYIPVVLISNTLQPYVGILSLRNLTLVLGVSDLVLRGLGFAALETLTLNPKP